MIRIIRGKYGPDRIGAGEILSLDEANEKRLVERRVAVYTDRTKQECGVPLQLEIDIKTKEELAKFKSKKEIIEYAKAIGLHKLTEETKKEELIGQVLNYIEENLEVKDEA